jgi:hypothetical protein
MTTSVESEKVKLTSSTPGSTRRLDAPSWTFTGHRLSIARWRPDQPTSSRMNSVERTHGSAT